MLNEKQEQFCHQYLVDANGAQASIRAGYHPNNGSRLLAKPEIRQRVADLMEDKIDRNIATADEILRYLTSVMRGESHQDVSDKERLKAAMLLGKRYGLYREVVSMDVTLPVIVDDV